MSIRIWKTTIGYSDAYPNLGLRESLQNKLRDNALLDVSLVRIEVGMKLSTRSVLTKLLKPP